MTLSPRTFSQFDCHRFLFLVFLIGLVTLAGCTFSDPTFTVPANDNGRHVLYITDESIPPGAIASNIRTLFEPTEVQGWDFVAHVTPDTRIDTIIIDGAIPVERIHAEWVSSAYDQGVRIVALDRYTPELAEVVGDPSIMDDNWVTGDDPYPSHFYVAVKRHIDPRCSFGNATRIVENVESGVEVSATAIIGSCVTGGGLATYSLEEPFGFETLRNVVNR